MVFTSSRIPVLLAAALALALGGCGQSGSSGSEAQDSSSVDHGKPYVGARIMQTPVVLGDPVVIDISGANFPLLEGGGIGLAFDPAVLQVERVELDPAWEFAGRAGQIDNAAGSVSEILFSSFDGNGGSVRIATIYGRIVGPGASALEIDVAGLFPFASDGSEVEMQFETSTVGID